MYKLWTIIPKVDAMVTDSERHLIPIPMRQRRCLTLDASKAINIARILVSVDDNRWHTVKEIHELSGYNRGAIKETLFMMSTLRFLDVFSKYVGGAYVRHYLLFKKTARGNNFIALIARRMSEGKLTKDEDVLRNMWAEVGDCTELLSLGEMDTSVAKVKAGIEESEEGDENA